MNNDKHSSKKNKKTSGEKSGSKGLPFFIRFSLFLLVLGFFANLLGCSGQMPDEKKNYIGEWRGHGIRLRIYSDGMVDYKRHRGSTKVKINMGITEFDGDDFIVGFWFLTTRFNVSRPPHQENGEWRMTVDDVNLTRTRALKGDDFPDED